MAKSKAKAAKAAKPKAASGKKGQADKERARKAKSAAAGTKPVPQKAQDDARAARERPRAQINANKLHGLYNDVETLLEQAASRTGKARELVGAAKKDANLNPAVWPVYRKLRKMGLKDPNALMVWLEDFDQMRELKGKNFPSLDDIAGPNMFKASDGGEEDDADDPKEPEPAPPTTPLPGGEPEPPTSRLQ